MTRMEEGICIPSRELLLREEEELRCQGLLEVNVSGFVRDLVKDSRPIFVVKGGEVMGREVVVWGVGCEGGGLVFPNVYLSRWRLQAEGGFDRADGSAFVVGESEGEEVPAEGESWFRSRRAVMSGGRVMGRRRFPTAGDGHELACCFVRVDCHRVEFWCGG